MPISIAITRNQIPLVTIGSNTLMVSGNVVSGDLGAGAIYTSQGSTSSGPMAIQDSAGTWYNLVLNNEPISVGWFGAKGDGTTDDTAAINASIIAVNAAGGGAVIFPHGTFMVNPTANSSGGNQGITVLSNVGFYIPPGVTIQATTQSLSTYAIFKGVGVTNVKFSGLGTVNGERATHIGSTGQFGMGIWFENSSNIQISGITVSNCWGDGVYIGDGVALASSTNINISDCVLNNNRRNNASLINVIGAVIKGNVFSNANGTAPQNGLDLEPDVGCVIQDVAIIGNIFADNATSGLSLAGSAAPLFNIQVIGNTIYGSSGNSFVISGTSNSTIQGNVINNSGDTTHNVVGINNSVSVNFSNNDVTGGAVGIYVQGSTTAKISVSNNSFNNQFSRGIYFESTTSGLELSVEGNLISTDSGFTTVGGYFGIYANAHNMLVANNNLSLQNTDASGVGIHVNQGGSSINGAIVTGNMVRSTAMLYAIRTEVASQNNWIVGNYVQQSIHDSGTPNNTVSGNFTIF